MKYCILALTAALAAVAHAAYDVESSGSIWNQKFDYNEVYDFADQVKRRKTKSVKAVKKLKAGVNRQSEDKPSAGGRPPADGKKPGGKPSAEGRPADGKPPAGTKPADGQPPKGGKKPPADG